MSNLQLEFSSSELLESEAYAEPLFAGGVKCHGGFDAEGNYVSPRTKNRWRAIENWEAKRLEDFGTPVLDIPLETWPENYPNVAQAKYLISEGVREPVIATLTRIGTVEGFGAMIRYSAIPDMQKIFYDDVAGTALSHLDRGLFEAHARDEAGFGDEGGHKQMWFAARDIAFENPITEDETQRMLERMGIAQAVAGAAKGSSDPAAIAKQLHGIRHFEDVDFDLEVLIERMTRLLLIEISAFHVFAWAQDVLDDTDLVAGEGEAGKLVTYIRTDEGPHVAYLKTVLSEIRDRTLKGDSGKKIPGTEVVGRIWDRALSESLGDRREEMLRITLNEVTHALAGNPRRGEILDRFHELGSIRPDQEGNWVDREGRIVHRAPGSTETENPEPTTASTGY